MKDSRGYRNVLVLLLPGVLLLLGLILEFIIHQELYAQFLFLLTVVASGYELALEGFRDLFLRRRLTIDLLITLAAAGSFLIGHGEEGAAVVFLFSIAEYLEEMAEERVKRSVASLMELSPETATVRRGGEEMEVPVGDVDLGDKLVIRPWEKIPLDGVVIRGKSTVNQAPITGESMPVTKNQGDEAFAGTINNEGYLEVRVTKRSHETVLSRIVRLVEEAQLRRSPTERFIDRFSRYYTPSVVLMALGVAILPTLVFGQPFEAWLYKALTLLVVSCPCALAISTPVAMVSGITSGARNGILIKGSRYVEEVSGVNVYALDKTGTLSMGELAVTDIVPLTGSKEGALSLAASLEAQSEHPIAAAIVKKAEEEDIEFRRVESFEAVTGKGVTGMIDGGVYRIGSSRLFEELGIEYPEETLERLASEGKTVVIVGGEGKALALIAVMDKIRYEAQPALQRLKAMGIRTEMLTGDNERTAKAIAERLGVDEYHAELLPEDKVRLVEEMHRRYGHVAMVGDGVNDAPALARASVGVAMGAIGSDVALDTADIALLQDDLEGLPYLVDLSNKTMNVVKQNIAASILIKGSFVVLTFPGLISLWLAVAIGDMGLSLAVILNSMRLSRVKPR